MKTTKEYVKILKAVLKMQIEMITHDENYEKSNILQGEELGLYIALDKIEASKFLYEN